MTREERISGDLDLLGRAVEVFARGYSVSSPSVPRQAYGRRPLKGGPRKRGDYQREEWIGRRIRTERYYDAAQKHSIPRHCVSAICPANERDETIRAGVKDAVL